MQLLRLYSVRGRPIYDCLGTVCRIVVVCQRQRLFDRFEPGGYIL